MALTTINSAGITDASIVNADINASAAIAKTKLASLDVVNADVSASAGIVQSKLATLAIDTTELVDNGVTLAKLDHGTQGDVLYYAASGAPTRLGVGTSGQFLKTQGASANPIWASVTLTTINTNAVTRIITGSNTADTLNGESGLTFGSAVLTVTGNILPEANGTRDLGSNGTRWANVYSSDIHLNNTGTNGNEVDGSEGSWTIQEGSDNLFLLNRKNGKRFKFLLEEI